MILAIALATSMAGPATLGFRGVCDASAGWFVSGHLLVLNDEDQQQTLLRMYDPVVGGGALHSIPLDTGPLALDPKAPEIDLEALTRIGDLYFAIGSHSRNKEGKKRTSRRRLFAFRLPESDGTAEIVGRPYKRLIRDLGRHLKRQIGLSELDPHRDPKDGGLSIEGLAATPDGALLIGLRSPLHNGRAIVACLTNPHELMLGKRARFGPVAQLDLAQGGVRDIAWSDARKRYLLIAGPVGSGGPFGLYQWSGEVRRPADRLLDLTDLVPEGAAPEGLVLPEGPRNVLVLMDEGARLLPDGGECKDAPPADQRFRGIWVTLP